MILTTYDEIVQHLYHYSDKPIYILITPPCERDENKTPLENFGQNFNNLFFGTKKVAIKNVKYTNSGVDKDKPLYVLTVNDEWVAVEQVYNDMTEEEFYPSKKKKSKKKEVEVFEDELEITQKIGDGRVWL